MYFNTKNYFKNNNCYIVKHPLKRSTIDWKGGHFWQRHIYSLLSFIDLTTIGQVQIQYL
jgi:hypothetical protein